MKKITAGFLVIILCLTELPLETLQVRAQSVTVSENTGFADLPDEMDMEMEEYVPEAVSDNTICTPENLELSEADEPDHADVYDNADGENTEPESVAEPPQAAVLTGVTADTYQSIKLIFEMDQSATGYEIYRGIKADESDMTLIRTIADNKTITYTDAGLNTGTTYYYKVRAYVSESDAGQNLYGDFSKTMSATPNLEQVENVKAASESYKSVVISFGSVDGADGYEIYYATSASGSYTLAGKTTGNLGIRFSHTKPALTTGKKYYYKVCAYRMVDGKTVTSPFSSVVNATPTLPEVTLKSVTAINYKTIKISYKKVTGAGGYVIYRSTKSDKGFKKIGTVKKGSTTTFKDKKCKTGVKYYYKVRAYRKVSGKTRYGGYSKVKKGQTGLSKPTQNKPVLTGGDTAFLSWSRVSGAEGYIVYRAENKSGTYKKVMTVSKGAQTSCEIAGQKNGKTYYYKVRAYFTLSGKKKYSPYSDIKKLLFNFYGYENESYTQRAQRIFGTNYYRKYGSKAAAEANMTTITIAVWDFNKTKTAKVTKYVSLTVHKNIAPTVQQIFKEIYEGEEQFPIKSIGGYSWRGDSSNSEHNQGLAIDINPEENYMIDGDTILSGKYWKPGEDPYSIPENSEVVTTMRKYGFFRGIWGDRRDYMHFSYFGT